MSDLLLHCPNLFPSGKRGQHPLGTRMLGQVQVAPGVTVTTQASGVNLTCPRCAYVYRWGYTDQGLTTPEARQLVLLASCLPFTTPALDALLERARLLTTRKEKKSAAIKEM